MVVQLLLAPPGRARALVGRAAVGKPKIDFEDLSGGSQVVPIPGPTGRQRIRALATTLAYQGGVLKAPPRQAAFAHNALTPPASPGGPEPRAYRLIEKFGVLRGAGGGPEP